MTKLFNKLTWGMAIAITMIALVSCAPQEKEIKYVATKLVDSDMWSIVDVNTGEVIHKDEFKSQPSVIVNDKFCVKNEGGLYDYFSVDNVTKPINSESYLYATSFNENDIAITVSKGKGISIINGKCENVATLDNSIVAASVFSNGYSAITNDENKKGYINEKGDIIIKPTYDMAHSFSEDGFAIVGKELNDTVNRYSAIDASGKELFSFSSSEYSDFGSFVNGYIPVRKSNDEVVLLNKSGKKVCSIGKWKGYIPYWLGVNDGVIAFKDGDAFGLKDKDGKIVIRAKYDELIPLPKINKSYYLAKKQNKYGIVDKNDKVIIPFDYTVLGYINKKVLIVGEGKTFSFMNTDLKDVGQNNYTNLSFMTGSSIQSNHFNADKEARRIISNITDSTFFKTRKGMVLRDFKDKLSGYKYADLKESTLTEYDYPFTFLYGFDNNLSSERYEYFYGYRLPKGAEYNYNANLALAMAINSTFKEYQPGAEESLAKAFDAQIQRAGFKPMDGHPNYFVNDKTGTTVGLGYDDGTVSVYYAYLPKFTKLKIERKPREEFSKDDVQFDYVDTFGLENKDDTIAVDSVAVIDETVDID